MSRRLIAAVLSASVFGAAWLLSVPMVSPLSWATIPVALVGFCAGMSLPMGAHNA